MRTTIVMMIGASLIALLTPAAVRTAYAATATNVRASQGIAHVAQTLRCTWKRRCVRQHCKLIRRCPPRSNLGPQEEPPLQLR
jgi:hypothetical protein